VVHVISMLEWIIRIWGDRLETVFGVMLIVQGFVRCDAGSMWFVIMHKSKDLLKERPPMKIVQP
jgi:hypothetical protein